MLMGISLCVIAGNESEHIERLLASFAPAFDELSLVIATGSTAPDDTAAKAEAWCAANGKACILGTYRNAPGNGNLPHIDNFAEARNAAFAQANGEWLFWADCDDLIDDAAALRRQIENAGENVMLRFPYSVPQSGKQTVRERVIRRDTFKAGRRWHWPVHENLLMHDGDKWESRTSPVWRHAPTGPKAGGEKRNLRLLTAALRDAPTNYYYCHQENFHQRNTEAAQRFGELFLGLPGGNPTMRYQCLLNLAELADEKEKAAIYAMRAHYLYPRQKEALAALTKCAFQDDSTERALHWSIRLLETPHVLPAERLWCYEPKWDGWGAKDLRARALRMDGQEALAATYDPQKPRIALLHATRGRVNRAIQCRELWLDLADDPGAVEHIFAIDDDDEDSVRWLRGFRRVVSSGKTCVAAWNMAALAAKADVFLQLSDDWVPFRGWDTALAKKWAGADPRVEQFALWVSDGTRKDGLMCMAILSRARWEAQGREMFSAEYESMFSDNEYSFRAFRDRVVVDARDLTFKHMHPVFGKGEWDETYRRQNAPEKYQRGLDTYHRRNPDAPRLTLPNENPA
jgi:glycosyltransferase involved in cell wall biosynthesis